MSKKRLDAGDGVVEAMKDLRDAVDVLLDPPPSALEDAFWHDAATAYNRVGKFLRLNRPMKQPGGDGQQEQGSASPPGLAPDGDNGRADG